jgi:heparin/heparan-sulfate lyase
MFEYKKLKINTLLFWMMIITGMIFISNRTLGQNFIRTSPPIVYPVLTEREGKELNIPIPPNEHPRLFFRKNDIPGFRNKMNNPLMADCWNRIVENATIQTDGILPQNGENHNMDIQVLNSIEAKAFLYAFQGNQSAGMNAIRAVLNYNKTLVIDHKKADVCRDIGRVILTNAIIYDWCYHLINIQEKQLLINWMESFGKQLEIEWPKLIQGSIVGHGTEAQLIRDMLACGIATYDEKPEIYNLVTGRIFAEFIPARKYFYSASYHHQGSSYGPYRFQFDMILTLIFDRLGFPQILGPDQAKVPYWWIYLRRPDGQLFRIGDDFTEQYTEFGKYWSISCCAIAGSYFRDQILMREAFMTKLIGKDPLFDFLFIDPLPFKTNNLSPLPLSRYFKEPLGAMVARTGWEEDLNSDNVIAFMKIGGSTFANHEHLDAGSFQIYYKGPLTVRSGIYQGKMGGYRSEHFLNYYQRSIAHNSILIFDPNEKYRWHGKEIINDGGQQYQNDAKEPVNLKEFQQNDYKVGEVLSHAFGPDTIKPIYTYLKGEISESYSDKVKSLQRSFVFLNLNNSEIPAALIVFDRLDISDKAFKKTFLLHSIEEPTIYENNVTIKCTQKGYNGQLVNTTLLPNSENLSIKKIGGTANEYTVNGKNFPQYFNSEKNSGDGAVWRIEISPKNNSSVDYFLNVIQVMGATGKSKPLVAEKLENEIFFGVKIKDWNVFFRKNGKISNQQMSLSLDFDGLENVWIGDLQEGLWKVKNIKENKGIYCNVKKGENILKFQGTSGTYKISRQ